MKKIVVIDGQGGRMGKSIIEQLKKNCPEELDFRIYALGTNSAATQAMIKGGADFGATGENPMIVNCKDADMIIGPIGILIADSLLGEITPAMAGPFPTADRAARTGRHPGVFRSRSSRK